MTGASATVGRLRIVVGQPQRRDDGAHDRGMALLVVHLGQGGFVDSDRGLVGVADVTQTRVSSSKTATALRAE
jgi:hypothetical protein